MAFSENFQMVKYGHIAEIEINFYSELCIRCGDDIGEMISKAEGFGNIFPTEVFLKIGLELPSLISLSTMKLYR